MRSGFFASSYCLVSTKFRGKSISFAVRLLASWQSEIIRRRCRRSRWSRRSVSDNPAFFHHKRDALSRRDVRGRIAWHCNDIGQLAFFESPTFCTRPKSSASIAVRNFNASIRAMPRSTIDLNFFRILTVRKNRSVGPKGSFHTYPYCVAKHFRPLGFGGGTWKVAAIFALSKPT